MIAIAAFFVSLVALVFSGIALAITYRKEAHRIRLELSPAKYGGVVLGINNDSGIDTSVRSIGYFHHFPKITWLTGTVGDYVINKNVKFPLPVNARSTFEVYLNTDRTIPNFGKAVGLCVQLDTGRFYVLPQKVARYDAIKMHVISWISRVTGGRYAPGVQRPRIKVDE
ncbi:hypothetical protein DUD43_09155 [Alcaligenes faecalis]|uniref:hypothetical protein n=1 Tax=Alcaligenes faecalis TaxID=511 RepID=UPI001292E708|nr:hypothetical protein [Alcaligenes faecalis]QFY77838.1 hypothetical protein DUD43_09155 [Alcaligenes faecalis]